ncbi:helix-turn-helix domain-containing protein [Anaerococcus sp. AGMB09787]|uniref:PucR family transcriptional regulator n=1 Tax=Anaerococcus sp. AGMB09787 TaxID=2922869 RepID=UPI001FAF85BF|nr:helix-turn-helix domain-containing protein [Anaerococcus sp. AGMB09787]
MFFYFTQNILYYGGYTNNKITFYEDLDIGKIITSIESKEIYVYSFMILKNIPNKDLRFYKSLINLYGKYNGSINKISENLYMHKNTIQYRLNKIKEFTGYDPRNIKDYMVLWFAFISID